MDTRDALLKTAGLSLGGASGSAAGLGSASTTAGKRNRPCDACRKRKNKCVTEDGNTVCVLCKLHGQDCLYNEAPQPRKRPSNPPSLGAVVAGASQTTSAPATTSNKRTKTFHLKPGTGVEEYDTLPGPSLLKRTLGLQNRHHTEYIGPHALPDVYGQHNLDALESAAAGATTANSDDAEKRPTTDYVRFVGSDQAFRIIPDHHTPGYDVDFRVIDDIESQALGHGPALVELYFRTIHPSFPVLHKDVFLEKYARSYREFSPPLLAAVYLLASGYWSYSDSLSKLKRIDTSKLEALAFAAMQDTLRRPKISGLQAGLLLSQYQKASSGSLAMHQQDRLTVQLVNLAHGLGIHLDCSEWQIPSWEISLRRRVGWGLYMQDKWTALLEGRPSLISREDWEVQRLTDDDFPENMEDDQEGSSEVERGRLVFMHMAALSDILADILKTLFSARARSKIQMTPHPVATLVEAVKPIQARLRDFSSYQPAALNIDAVASMKLSSVGYFQLAHLSVEVCLHRHIIRTLIAKASSSGMPADPSEAAFAQMCRNEAREHFTKATDFVQRLQAQHLPAFWYFGSAKCCALVYSLGRAMEASAWTEDEEGFYTRKLKEFKWALRVNGEAGAAFMTHALALINRPARLASRANEVDNSSTTSPSSINFAMGNNYSAMPSIAMHSGAPAGNGTDNDYTSSGEQWSPDNGVAYLSDGAGTDGSHFNGVGGSGDMTPSDPSDFFAGFSDGLEQVYAPPLLDDNFLAQQRFQQLQQHQQQQQQQGMPNAYNFAPQYHPRPDQHQQVPAPMVHTSSPVPMQMTPQQQQQRMMQMNRHLPGNPRLPPQMQHPHRPHQDYTG